MTSIRAFDGCTVKPDRLRSVVSPAYDSLSPQERHTFGREHPQNYINVMRSSDEYPEDRQPSQREILQINAANLKAMLDAGDFQAVEKPSLFIYRLKTDNHEQTAVVCEIPIDHYDSGKVLRHENTRSDKENQLTDYLDVVGASSSPACLAYRKNQSLEKLLTSVTRGRPLCEFYVHDEVVQTLWQIDDEQLIRRFTDAFASVDKTYLTDGHHRFAAGSRFAQKRRQQNPNNSGEEDYNHVLVALFSADQLRILPYNRCVRDLNGLSVDQLVDRLGEAFDVVKVDTGAIVPNQRHQFGMHVDGHWYRLTLSETPPPDTNPVESLDVTILQDRILVPILGIEDARSDSRLHYVSGDTGVAGLEQRCKEGWALGFSCFPTSIDQLIKVADIGEVMPPKSTYFDPKVRSGIFLRLY